MMPKSDLKRLQRKWYKRLGKEGFKDIEQLSQSGQMGEKLLRPAVNNKNKFHDPKLYVETTQYYRLVCWFLHEYEFKDVTQKCIWWLYSEGKTIREIGEVVCLSPRAVHVRLHAVIDGPFKDYRRLLTADIDDK